MATPTPAIRPRSVNGAPGWVYEIACHGRDCSATIEVPVRSVATGSSEKTGTLDAVSLRRIERALDAANWAHKSGLRRPFCPACRPPLRLVCSTPDSIEDTAPEDTDMTATPATTTPASRVATPADRRRIGDALEAAYDCAAGRYRGAGSDAVIAKSLDVPRLWVTETREFSYGIGGGNEADAARDGEIRKIEARIEDLAALGQSALETLARLDTGIKEARRALELIRR